MLDAEQPRRRWLVRLAALQACLVVAVVTLRQKPRPGTELLQHSRHPRELSCLCFQVPNSCCPLLPPRTPSTRHAIDAVDAP